MSGYPYGLPDDDALGIVELLGFLADFCRAEDEILSAALDRFVGTGYDAGDFADDARRLVGALAQAVGLKDSSLELAP